METPRTVAILGAGQAGGWVARTLRRLGFDGRIVLIGEERHRPYERPPLSKGVLSGAAEPETTALFAPDLFDGLSLDFRPGLRAVAIDREAGRVALEDGGLVAYDRLVLATGGRPRRLPMPEALASRIHYLRTLEDSLALRAALGEGRRIAVIGGGWIGLEVAATARGLGTEVTVIEAADRLCARVAGRELADWLRALHSARGVDLRLATQALSVGASGDGLALDLSDGTRVEAGAIVVGVGILPDSALAAEAGLRVADGILVDAEGRTSDPAIFAVGDVAARPDGRGGHRRLESWANAQNEGIAVAHALLGLERPAEEIPWFWSDQYDANIQMLGACGDEFTALRRPGPDGRSETVLYLRNGALAGVHACNAARDIQAARRLIARGVPLDPARVADPAVPLRALLTA